MAEERVRKSKKSKGYKELIRMVAHSSGYMVYEVEDVLDHFIGNVQALLAQDIDVKLSGLGTIKISAMNVNNTIKGQKIQYTTHRLSIGTDEPMRRYLQENYVARSDRKKRRSNKSSTKPESEQSSQSD